MSKTVQIGDDSYERLNQLADRSGLPPEKLADEAIGSLYRSRIGEPVPQLGLPFKKDLSDLDSDVVLRQVDPTRFHLEEPFRFRRPGQPDVRVPRGDVTDLASVPDFLTWFVPRYGRHTLPALLHDHQVARGMSLDDRERADTTFRDAMRETKVPLVRRWLMWAAVSVATQFLRSWPWKVLVVAWVGLYALAGVGLFLDLTGWWSVPLVSAVPAPLVLVSPLVLALLWGRRYRLGLIAAYTVLVLPVSTLAVGATLVIYLFAEWIAQRYLGLRGAEIVPVRVGELRDELRPPADTGQSGRTRPHP